MKKPIIVPNEIMPKPMPWRNCECMKHPVDLSEKKGTLTWIKSVGDSICEGDVICEGEADKKTVEITAPCSGVLAEQTVEDECVFKAGDILGYIEEA